MTHRDMMQSSDPWLRSIQSCLNECLTMTVDSPALDPIQMASVFTSYTLTTPNYEERLDPLVPQSAQKQVYPFSTFGTRNEFYQTLRHLIVTVWNRVIQCVESSPQSQLFGTNSTANTHDTKRDRLFDTMWTIALRCPGAPDFLDLCARLENTGTKSNVNHGINAHENAAKELCDAASIFRYLWYPVLVVTSTSFLSRALDLTQRSGSIVPPSPILCVDAIDICAGDEVLDTLCSMWSHVVCECFPSLRCCCDRLYHDFRAHHEQEIIPAQFQNVLRNAGTHWTLRELALDEKHVCDAGSQWHSYGNRCVPLPALGESSFERMPSEGAQDERRWIPDIELYPQFPIGSDRHLVRDESVTSALMRIGTNIEATTQTPKDFTKQDETKHCTNQQSEVPLASNRRPKNPEQVKFVWRRQSTCTLEKPEPAATLSEKIHVCHLLNGACLPQKDETSAMVTMIYNTWSRWFWTQSRTALDSFTKRFASFVQNELRVSSSLASLASLNSSHNPFVQFEWMLQILKRFDTVGQILQTEQVSIAYRHNFLVHVAWHFQWLHNIAESLLESYTLQVERSSPRTYSHSSTSTATHSWSIVQMLRFIVENPWDIPTVEDIMKYNSRFALLTLHKIAHNLSTCHDCLIVPDIRMYPECVTTL